jgi:hypothetical protein
VGATAVVEDEDDEDSQPAKTIKRKDMSSLCQISSLLRLWLIGLRAYLTLCGCGSSSEK